MSFGAIAGILTKVIGLNPDSIGHPAIERVVRRRMSATGLVDMGRYLKLLHGPGGELRELIDAVTIPETWFYRKPEAFALLRNFALERWQPQAAGKLLRLASLPCSTGEEPYSMVMCLLDAGLESDSFQVDAIDVNRNVLALADQGLYGKVSFRSKDLGFKRRYFEAMPEGYQLHQRVRRNVTLRHGNILKLATLLAGRSYDVIFCRNLLIYLNQVNRKHTIEQLKQLLSPSGLLFVGHAEASLFIDAGFHRVPYPQAFAFTLAAPKNAVQKTKRPRPVTLATAAATGKKRAKPASLTPLPELLVPAAQSGAKATSYSWEPDAASQKQSSDLNNVRRLADQGQLEQARQLCEEYLRGGEVVTAEIYFLLGLIHDAEGQRERAVELYRKASYLDPAHEPTLIQLALCAEQQGDTQKAQVLRERAARAGERNGGHIQIAGEGDG